MKEGWGVILDWSLNMTLADISWHLARKLFHSVVNVTYCSN